MSRASRQLPPISSTLPASIPNLVDRNARIDRATLRVEVARMVRHGGWQHGDALVRLMQKARLQVKWARDEIAERAARREARKAAKSEGA